MVVSSVLLAAMLVATGTSSGTAPASTTAPAPSAPTASPLGQSMVHHARELLGVPYLFGGRLRPQGIDCQGVLFYAAERVAPCGWKSYSVFPTKSVADRELGARVRGLDPIATSALDLARLTPGDIILMVGFDANPSEPAIGKLGGRDVWVWHTGLYAGGGRWIVGDHFAGEVVEVPLLAYLEEHRDDYAGVFVTRIAAAPAPRRCRKHAPMTVTPPG